MKNATTRCYVAVLLLTVSPWAMPQTNTGGGPPTQSGVSDRSARDPDSSQAKAAGAAAASSAAVGAAVGALVGASASVKVEIVDPMEVRIIAGEQTHVVKGEGAKAADARLAGRRLADSLGTASSKTTPVVISSANPVFLLAVPAQENPALIVELVRMNPAAQKPTSMAFAKAEGKLRAPTGYMLYRMNAAAPLDAGEYVLGVKGGRTFKFSVVPENR